MSDRPTPILCPGCGGEISYHEDRYQNCYCAECLSDHPEREYECQLTPSDIARALLTAEPTDAEVEAAARAAWHHGKPHTPWRDLPEDDQNDVRGEARAALRAARQVRG